MIFRILALSFGILNTLIINPELIIGKEKVAPGIVFIFEGAVKDQIFPKSMHLDKSQTNIHIEARVNWDNKNIPKGTPPGGFVPFLYVTTTVINQNSGYKTFVDLKPHINLIDNFHYARNIALPGSINGLYTVRFNITPPTEIDLAIHQDWFNQYGGKLLSNYVFEYEDINFKEIAETSRD